MGVRVKNVRLCFCQIVKFFELLSPDIDMGDKLNQAHMSKLEQLMKLNLTEEHISKQVISEALYEMVHQNDEAKKNHTQDDKIGNFLNKLEENFGVVDDILGGAGNIVKAAGDMAGVDVEEKLHINLEEDLQITDHTKENVNLTEIELQHNKTLLEQQILHEAALEAELLENAEKEGYGPNSGVESVLQDVLDVPNQISDGVEEFTSVFETIGDMHFQPGAFLAIASGIVNFGVGIFYATFSCCGLN